MFEDHYDIIFDILGYPAQPHPHRDGLSAAIKDRSIKFIEDVSATSVEKHQSARCECLCRIECIEMTI